jgi:chorismate dehydratase
MMRVRLGAVEYLNAGPLVYGLDRSARFDLRFDVPSTCATLLHAGDIDVGLIPSIEYLRGGPFEIVPDLAIASRGPVASVMLYTRREIADVRSIAMDTSSRTSVALTKVLCARLFRITPAAEPSRPDLPAMLARCDAALIIGDNALLLDPNQVPDSGDEPPIQAVDLGEAWNRLTGLPFVYAFWAGRPGVLRSGDVEELRAARDEGVMRADEIARRYFERPEWQAVGARYLRDNIKYDLGDEGRAGLELFYRYAAEIGLVDEARTPRFRHD